MPKKSLWTFETSGGASSGAGGQYIGAAIDIATLKLKDPEGVIYTYNYVDLKVTMGWSPGGKSGKGLSKSAGGSSEGMGSRGRVYMMDGFAGPELQPSDFEGVCMLGEASGSAKVLAGTGTVLWLGIPKSKLFTESANSPLGLSLTGFLIPGFGFLAGKVVDRVAKDSDVLPSSIFEQGANAVVVSLGQGTASSFGVGVAGGYGYVSQGAIDVTKIIPPPKPPPPDKPPNKVVTIPSDILFDFDKSELKLLNNDKGAPLTPIAVLWAAARQVQLKPYSMIVCHGHTDNVGAYGYNMVLATHRAESVRRWFTTMRIVPPERIMCLGHSYSQPVADNATEDGRRQNRRVEIAVY